MIHNLLTEGLLIAFAVKIDSLILVDASEHMKPSILSDMTAYSATLSSTSSLMLPESRLLADLLLKHPSDQDWKQRICVDNILQKPSPATATRVASLIKNRLSFLSQEGLRLVVLSERALAIQLLFVAALRHSQLLHDYLRDLYLPHVKRQEPIKKHDWLAFLDECAHRDAKVSTWTDSTREKLHQVITKILIETECLTASKPHQFTQPYLYPQTKAYLRDHQLDDLFKLFMRLSGNPS
jgi:hypothetical protein